MESHKILLLAAMCICLFSEVTVMKNEHDSAFQTELQTSSTSQHTSRINSEARAKDETILKLQLTKEEWETVTREVISELRMIVKAGTKYTPFLEESTRPIKGVRPSVADNVNVREIALNIFGMFGDLVQSKTMQSYLLSESFIRDVFGFIQADVEMPNEDKKQTTRKTQA